MGRPLLSHTADCGWHDLPKGQAPQGEGHDDGREGRVRTGHKTETHGRALAVHPAFTSMARARPARSARAERSPDGTPTRAGVGPPPHFHRVSVLIKVGVKEGEGEGESGVGVKMFVQRGASGPGPERGGKKR